MYTCSECVAISLVGVARVMTKNNIFHYNISPLFEAGLTEKRILG
jgi:hypothetical protein